MKKLLIEFLSEEIPARFQVDAFDQLKKNLETELFTLGFKFDNVEVDGTPRRMYFIADVANNSTPVTTEKRGPLKSAPEKAIAGFLTSNAISLEDCVEKEINGKVYLFATVTTKAQALTDVLPGIICKIINDMKWPKSMKWGSGDFMWARPLRNILCLYDNKVVEFDIPQLGKKSNNITFDHRSMGQGKIVVDSVENYKSLLAKGNVVLTRADRQNIILSEFDKIEDKYGIKINRHPGLLEEVIGLVEFPKVFVGQISDDFMHLPEEVLTTTMRINQRYFTTRGQDGKLSKYFVFVSNIKTIDNGATVINGNQKVLSARLYDAKFFFDQDVKTPLANFSSELAKITFHEGLGTVLDRVKRLTKIATQLSFLSTNPDLLYKAAELSKCDLKTSMVYEFPEVQGIMGGHYARLQGEDPYVYNAITEQYMPTGDRLPQTNGGILLSIVDKIDLLVSFFAVKKAPTGSKDPFGLRRAAIGILKQIIANRLEINNLRLILQSAFDTICQDFPDTETDPETVQNVMKFLKDRFIVIAADYGISKQLCLTFLGKSDNFLTTFGKAIEFSKSDYADQILSTFKRAYPFYCQSCQCDINESLFENEAESGLYNAIIHLSGKDVTLADLAKLDAPVNAFFDSVLVNADKEDVKNNRLSLVKLLLDKFFEIGDFSYLL